MSYERIEIPNAFCTKDLESFYEDKEWEQGEIQSDYDEISYFKCFNSFKNYENTVHLFGRFSNYGSPQNYGRMTLNIDVNTKIISANNIRELEEPKDIIDNEDERSGFVEQVHIPFYDRGDWYLPIVTRNSNYMMKWDATNLVYKNFN